MKTLVFFPAFIASVIFHTSIQAQYYRDRTKFIHLDNSYPVDDSRVLNLYQREEVYSLTLHNIFNEPEIMVDFSGKKYPLVFDFGNSGNIVITTALANSVKYSIIDTVNTYTPDGKIKGQVYDIEIPQITVLDETYSNEKATLMDWAITSSAPYNGLVGLKYLKGKCFTLSYPKKLLAVSKRSITAQLSPGNHCIIPLELFSYHPSGIHFKGKVDNQDAIIYFDTGRNISEINKTLVPSDKIVSDKSGNFYNGTVNIVFGTLSFDIYFPRVSEPRRIKESKLPVGIQVGSDILKYLLLTVDRTNNQELLIIHK